METIVIFYSLDGNTKMIAETIAETVNADLLELKPVKEITRNNFLKMFAGGKQAILKAEPELLPLNLKPEDYDVIFIGTPVWAWTFAPALRTFFTNVKLRDKKIALFCCHGGGPGKIFEKFESELEGNLIAGKADFKEPLKNNTKEQAGKAQKWAERIISDLKDKKKNKTE